jgi:K+-transporting ATPase KdpF subunit
MSLALVLASAGDNLIGLAISVGIVAYLVYVLVFPERF